MRSEQTENGNENQNQNQAKQVIGSISAGLGETQIEIVICQRDGQDVAILQLGTWHETLGWQVQKTIPFSASKIGQLQRLLSETRNRLEEREAQPGAMAQIIEFAVRGSRTQASLSGSQPTTQTPTTQTEDQTASAIS